MPGLPIGLCVLPVPNTSNMKQTMPKPSDEYNLMLSRPDLVREWHPSKNGSLSPRDVRIDSSRDVYWLCDQGHWWLATVADRVSGMKCSYCRELQAKGIIRMASAMPGLLKEWHPSKNQGLRAQDMPANHAGEVWWMCEAGHEWQATIPSRLTGESCPACAFKVKPVAIAAEAEGKSSRNLRSDGADTSKDWNSTEDLHEVEPDDYAGQEKRRSPRFSLISTVMVESSADEIIGYAELRNHSEGGLQIKAEFPIRAYTSASIRFESPFHAAPQVFEGRVIWCRRLDASDSQSRFTIGLASRTWNSQSPQ
jgi:hypothetical protein